MSDFKTPTYAKQVSDGYEERMTGVGTPAKPLSTPSRKAPRKSAPQGNGGDVRSWDAYRNWLTKVQAPNNRRSMPDVALFSWKGYRSWAEKVRRDWEDMDD